MPEADLLLKKIARHRMDIAQIDDRFRVFLASGKKIPTEDKVPPYLVADRLSFQDSGVDEFGRGMNDGDLNLGCPRIRQVACLCNHNHPFVGRRSLQLQAIRLRLVWPSNKAVGTARICRPGRAIPLFRGPRRSCHVRDWVRKSTRSLLNWDSARVTPWQVALRSGFERRQGLIRQTTDRCRVNVATCKGDHRRLDDVYHFATGGGRVLLKDLGNIVWDIDDISHITIFPRISAVIKMDCTSMTRTPSQTLQLGLFGLTQATRGTGARL